MKMISHITLLAATLLPACGLTTAAQAQTTVEWMVLSISHPRPLQTSSAVAPATASLREAVIGQALRPALVRAGFERVDVWSAATGDGEEYLLTRPLASLAELEQPGSLARALGPDGAAAWWSGLAGVELELRAALVRARPDLSLAAPSASPLRQAVLTRVEVAPGHANEKKLSASCEFRCCLTPHPVRAARAVGPEGGGT